MSASENTEGGVRRLLVIPAYNEAEALPELLARIRDAQLDIPCVVVDDGSEDETAQVARASGVRVLRHPFNLGYGSALQTGYKYALATGADFLVQMDADGQHDPLQVPNLLAPVEAGECDLVVGSRFQGAASYRMGVTRTIGKQVFRAIARLFGLAITDQTSGFQAMNRAVIEVYATDFFPNDFPDVDVLVRLHRHGLKIREQAVQMASGVRQSRIHGGLRSMYYVYKMILSLWAATSVEVRRPARPGKAGPRG